ncbi:unnamed protein product [Peniophora sp. CBMAI 1063]|nr:unnamed protein product [Peniophora sp. CBMAI 1063]
MHIKAGILTAIGGILVGASARSTTNSTLSVHYGIVIFPAFQALDVFGPLDVFNMLAFNYNITLTHRLDPRPRLIKAARHATGIQFFRNNSTYTHVRRLSEGSGCTDYPWRAWTICYRCALEPPLQLKRAYWTDEMPLRISARTMGHLVGPKC